MRPVLRVVRATSETVSLPRYLVVEAAMDATALADDLARALTAIEQRMWAGNRAGAVNEIGRAHQRLEEMRSAFIGLAGIADTHPADPAGAQRVA